MSTRIGNLFLSDTDGLTYSGNRRYVSNRQRQHEMHRRTQTRAVADRPNSPAQRTDGIGAPMQADAVVGVAIFGREILVEYALQSGGGDADAVVLAMQVQMFAVRFLDDFGGKMQHALVAARIAHRIRGIDDQVL